MKIAVTGGNGKVGRGFVEMALSEGHSVVNIDRMAPKTPLSHANLTFIQGDLADYDMLVAAFQGCDALAHIAAIPSPGHFPDHIVHNNNVTGSYNAMRAAVEVGIQKICQASSVNATGLAYSRAPRFDYFPLDEQHPTYSEDPYSLSKWICEEQANSIARRYETLTISSLRFHWVVAEQSTALNSEHYLNANLAGSKNLWAYTTLEASARATMLSLQAEYKGHEVFYIAAPDTASRTPSLELAAKYYPNVPVRENFGGHTSFFDCSKAEKILGWKHNH